MLIGQSVFLYRHGSSARNYCFQVIIEAGWQTVRTVIEILGPVRIALVLSGKATSLPGSKLPFGRGLQLAAPPSPLKPTMFLN